MIVKKYEAPSLEQALARVKSELGPNALILSTQQKRGNKWFQKTIIEVTAAFEQKMKQELDDRFDETELRDIFPHRKSQSAFEKTVTKKQEDKTLSPLIPERRMRPPSDEGKNRRFDSGRHDERTNRFDTTHHDERTNRLGSARHEGTATNRLDPSRFERDFLDCGFSQESASEFSRRLVFDYPARELEDPNFLNRTKAKLIAANLRTLSPIIFQSKSNWVVIGQPGAGKTTFSVKLASYLQTQKETVQLVSVDEKKVMGRSELASYAKLLKLPFSTEAGAQAQNTRLQIIDTPSLGGEKRAAKLEKICRNRNTILVIDASSRLREIIRTVESSARYAPHALAFTRLDQVADSGVIYDVLKQTKIPLLGLSTKGSLKRAVRFFESMELAVFLLGNKVAEPIQQ